MGPRATGPDDQGGEHSRGQVFLCQPREGGDGGHSSECKTRVESAVCDDAVGPNVSQNPRDEKSEGGARNWRGHGLEQQQQGSSCGEQRSPHVEEHEERLKSHGCRICKTL